MIYEKKLSKLQWILFLRIIDFYVAERKKKEKTNMKKKITGWEFCVIDFLCQGERSHLELERSGQFLLKFEKLSGLFIIQNYFHIVIFPFAASFFSLHV